MNGVTGTGTRRRYSAKVLAFARRLHEDGRSLAEVQAALNRQGYFPCFNTIARWVDEEYLEARNLERRNFRRAGPGPRIQSWQLKLRRVHELRRLGVSFRACTNILNHDFALALSNDQVRGIVQGTSSPETIRSLLKGGKAIRNGGGRPRGSLKTTDKGAIQ